MLTEWISLDRYMFGLGEHEMIATVSWTTIIKTGCERKSQVKQKQFSNFQKANG